MDYGRLRRGSLRLAGVKGAMAATGEGEIVEVEGGHIVRATGRKDRHSKVCTAKGLRDRRVRLSANTAIQFYDVQDRLGYDRPSKAVDWLIKKAKSAIDELDELPAWNPLAAADHNDDGDETMDHLSLHADETMNQNQQEQLMANQPTGHSAFLPPSLDSDSIADTIKSFFPTGAATTETTTASSSSLSSMQFPSYPRDLLSRSRSRSQDLKLSLQSFADPAYRHHQSQSQQSGQALLSAGFCAGWSDHQSSEIARLQRMAGFNAASVADSAVTTGGGFVFSAPSAATAPTMLFGDGENQFYSPRGPLQSSYTPSVRAWLDPSMAAAASGAAVEHHYQMQMPVVVGSNQQSLISSIAFPSSGRYAGLHAQARFRGVEDRSDGITDKPSSASSHSRH